VRVLGAFWGVVGCLWGHFFSLYEEEDEENEEEWEWRVGCEWGLVMEPKLALWYVCVVYLLRSSK